LKYNYNIIIEYDGTPFVGWQSQKKGLSVQSEIQKALKKLLKDNIKIIGSGRTDSGVHAFQQNANFYTHKNILDKKKFINSLNFFLQKNNISILDIKKKNFNFNARFSAKKRIYQYVIVNRFGSLSLEKNRAWHIKKKLNFKIIKKGAQLLIGTHDFSAFRSSSCGAKSPVKTISKIDIKRKKEKIYLIFESKSFLQQQVRSMVGCLKYLGEEKWSLNKLKKVLKSKQRSMCAPPAPAHGLYLKKIKY